MPVWVEKKRKSLVAPVFYDRFNLFMKIPVKNVKITFLCYLLVTAARL